MADGIDFGADRGIAPRQIFEISGDVFGEERTDFADRGGETPPFMGFSGGTFESDAVEIEFAVGGRARVTPAAVGEFVPFLGAGDVTLVAILPEYWANVFFFPAVCKTLLLTWGNCG
jgi:hypothetical protein